MSFHKVSCVLSLAFRVRRAQMNESWSGVSKNASKVGGGRTAHAACANVVQMSGGLCRIRGSGIACAGMWCARNPGDALAIRG